MQFRLLIDFGRKGASFVFKVCLVDLGARLEVLGWLLLEFDQELGFKSLTTTSNQPKDNQLVSFGVVTHSPANMASDRQSCYLNKHGARNKPEAENSGANIRPVGTSW